MRRYPLLLLISIFLLMMLPGCWNRRELNTLVVIQAFGVDRTEDDQILLSVQLLKPGEVKAGGKEKSSGEKGVWVVTSTGETVFDAIRNATLKADRKLFLSHNKVIIISESVAKKGIGEVIDLVNRDHEFRKLAYVFIAKGKAEEIIKGEHEQEKITGKAMENLAKTTFATSKVVKVRLLDLDKNLLSKTNDPIIPGMELIQVNENDQRKNLLSLDGTAIFKSDKLVGWFNGKETRGLLWVLGEVKSGIINVAAPEDDTKKVSLEIIKASGKVQPAKGDGSLAVTVNVQVEANLAEQMSGLNITNPDQFDKLEQEMSAAIEEEIQAAVVKAQKWDTDIFKFGEEFHRAYPKEWPQLEKTWNEQFPQIEVNVVIDPELRRTGLIAQPIMSNRREGEE